MRLAPLRAAGRVAWRQSRRSPWRSALVIAMIGIPIAGLCGAAIGFHTVTPTVEDRVRQQMGSADLSVEYSPRQSVDRLRRELPSGTTVVEQRLLPASVVVGGRFLSLTLREFSVPIDRSPTQGTYVIQNGRAPAARDEVALNPEVLADFGVPIGERLSLDLPRLDLRVTGTVVNPEHVDDPVGILGPGTLGELPSYGGGVVIGYLVDLPPDADADHVLSARFDLLGHGASRRSILELEANTDERTATAGSFAVAALLLVATCMIAGAALAVGAKRQLRTIGLIGAAGGEPRHARAVILLGGACLGLLGSVAGLVVGTIGVFLVHGYLDRVAGRIVGPVAVPPAPLSGAVFLGTLAATLAAYGPARSAARISTLRALSGTTPSPRAPGRIAGLGLLVVVAGAIVTAAATIAHSDPWLVAGAVAMMAGFLVAIPLLVTWTGKFAGVLPATPRIAMRGVARNGRRTGPALAAATIALALPVAVATITLSQESRDERSPSMADDQLVIETVGGLAGSIRHLQAIADEVGSAFPHWIVVPYRPAMTVDRGGLRRRIVWVRGPDVVTISQGGAGSVSIPTGTLAVGGPDLLRVLHAEEGIPALEAGSVVVIGRGGVDHDVVHLTRGPPRSAAQVQGDPGFDLRAVELRSPHFPALSSGEFDAVISPGRAAQLGLRPTARPSSTRLLLRAPTPLSDEDVQRVRDIVERDPGAFVTSANDLSENTLRLLVASVSIAFSLAILGVIVALLAAESRREQAILVAVGAGPGNRRAVAGATAWSVAALAGLLAVPMGFAPAAVSRAADTGDFPVVVPWVTIAVILLVMPFVAGAFGALVSRQPRAARLLRPIA